jgi:hypothetical protein
VADYANQVYPDGGGVPDHLHQQNEVVGALSGVTQLSDCGSKRTTQPRMFFPSKQRKGLALSLQRDIITFSQFDCRLVSGSRRAHP